MMHVWLWQDANPDKQLPAHNDILALLVSNTFKWSRECTLEMESLVAVTGVPFKHMVPGAIASVAIKLNPALGCSGRVYRIGGCAVPSYPGVHGTVRVTSRPEDPQASVSTAFDEAKAQSSDRITEDYEDEDAEEECDQKRQSYDWLTADYGNEDVSSVEGDQKRQSHDWIVADYRDEDVSRVECDQKRRRWRNRATAGLHT